MTCHQNRAFDRMAWEVAIIKRRDTIKAYELALKTGFGFAGDEVLPEHRPFLTSEVARCKREIAELKQNPW